MTRRPSARAILPLVSLGAIALASGHDRGGSPSAGSFLACVSIPEPGARLACYDRAAGRAAVSPSAPVPAQTVSAAPAAPVAPGAPAAPVAPAAPPIPARARPAPGADDSFGLYAAEHPAPPQHAPELKTKVIALGGDANGNPTVTLEGGQLWRLDDPDPLLAIGDRVTIRRAAFGSFLMFTPSGRVHRVARLR